MSRPLTTAAETLDGIELYPPAEAFEDTELMARGLHRFQQREDTHAYRHYWRSSSRER